MLWPFPIFCGSGKPIGDGIYWPLKSQMEEQKQGSNVEMKAVNNTDAAKSNSNRQQ